MQDEDLFYLEEFEEIFKKEGMVDIDFPKLSTRELLNYLKNIKKFFLLNDVEDSMLCGTYIAKNNNGILRYEPNNNEKLESIKHFMDKVRFFLNDYIVVVNELLNRKLNHKYDLILKADIEDVKSYCLRNGFYDKGLHFAKIINKKCDIDQIAYVEQTIVCYAQKQILTGDDQSKKVSNIVKSLLLKDYGELPLGKDKSYFFNLFNDADVNIEGKYFNVKDSQNAISTM